MRVTKKEKKNHCTVLVIQIQKIHQSPEIREKFGIYFMYRHYNVV